MAFRAAVTRRVDGALPAVPRVTRGKFRKKPVAGAACKAPDTTPASIFQRPAMESAGSAGSRRRRAGRCGLLGGVRGRLLGSRRLGPRRRCRSGRGTEVRRLSGLCALLPRDGAERPRVLLVVRARWARGSGRNVDERLHLRLGKRVSLPFLGGEDDVSGFVSRRPLQLEDPAVAQGQPGKRRGSGRRSERPQG